MDAIQQTGDVSSNLTGGAKHMPLWSSGKASGLSSRLRVLSAERYGDKSLTHTQDRT